MKCKFLMFIILGLILVSNVTAVVVIDRTDYALASKTQSSNGCIPPFDFAKEHNCELRYVPHDYTVGKYACANYQLYTDCTGNVTRLVDIAPSEAEMYIMFSIILFIIIFVFLFIIAKVFKIIN